MNKSKSIIFNKNKGGNNTIISLGYDLQFDLELSPTYEQFEENNIDFYEIKNIEYLKEKLNRKLISSIKIFSKNFLFNSILFINRANKTKSNINYIIPFKIKYSEKISFMEDIINEVLLNEGITIIPLDLKENLPQINFIINLIENNKITRTKKLDIFGYENYHKNKNNLYGDEKGVNLLINSINKCNYLITSISDYNNYIHIFLDEENFVNKIQNHLELFNVCIIYDDKPIYYHLKKIKNLGNIKIYPKNIKQYNDINNNNSNETKDSNTNLEIILDELKKIIIIQYDNSSKLAIFKIDEPIILDNIDEINDIVDLDNPYYLESVYIGAFLSRLLNSQTFNTCLTVSVQCLKKVLKLLKFKKEEKYFSYNNSYYEISVKKRQSHSQSQEDFKNYMFEHQFVLDGNNKSEMNKIKEYNSLYDENCRSYFEKMKNKNFLIKQGFIDKNGQIIINPEGMEKQKQFKTKKTVNFFQINAKKFNEIKNKNNISQKFFEKLSSGKEIDSKRNLNLDNFKKFNKYCYKDEFYLPPIKENNGRLKDEKLYYYDRSKEIVLKNLSKRYFEGNKSQLSYISFQNNNTSKNNKLYNSDRRNNLSCKNNKIKDVNPKKLDCYGYNKTIEFFGGFL